MSMTREETIELLRDTPIDIRSTREDDIYTLYATAQMMAIDALRPVSREQVEKIYPGCSKCLARGDRNVLNDPGAHDFRLKDSALVYWDEQYGWEGTKVLFCPWCGSPLTDEAVGITMRRLEALNEED